MTSAVPTLYREATLDIEGMTCASCVARVEKRLEKVDGVSTSVNLATESAREQLSADVDDARLVAAVAEAGYTARVRPVPYASSAQAHAHEERGTGDGHGPNDSGDHGPNDSDDPGGHQHDVEDVPGQTRLATRLIVSAALALPVVVLGMVPAWQFAGWQWVSLVLATPIVFWGGWPFHRAAFAAARHGAAAMDTLITLGTMAAYLWSVWTLFFGNAGQIGLRHDVVLFGPVHDATALVYFEVAAAVTVFLLLGRYIEQRSRRRAGAALRSLMDLGAKDVELESGRRIPVDRLRVDDTFVVRPGETIATDGIVVEGRAAVDASVSTGESFPIEVGTGGEVTGGTVAVDGRLLVRTGRGAQLGVLITGPEAIESANPIDTVLIDKTGTLTTGAMTVREVVVARDSARADVLPVASALEGRSEHPIARAIATFVASDGVPSAVSSGATTPTAVVVDDFRSHAGRGVTDLVDGVRAFAGSPAFAVGDDVRAGAGRAVASLREQGIDVVLLTGDGPGAAHAVAARVGIDEVVAGVLPEAKLAEVERRRAAGRRVAMVGDGVNDAAALAAADLGIAMGGGTDAAMHASDITLVRNGPESIVTALRLARRTMRTIRGNLFWAFGYNAAAIPLAALGLLNPMVAGLAMAFSSVFVVLNSLRLRSAR
ncbi:MULTISPECIES: heavy metal translocating P-type ATPase [Bacteria]